jgi:hypothetical protein
MAGGALERGCLYVVGRGLGGGSGAQGRAVYVCASVARYKYRPAHEFVNTLPVHQFVRDARRGWLEVCGVRELGWETGGGGVRTSLYPCTGWLEVLKGQWVGETGVGNKQAGRRHAEEGSVHQLLLVHA